MRSESETQTQTFIALARRGLWQCPEFVMPAPPSVALAMSRALTADGYQVLFTDSREDQPEWVTVIVRVAEERQQSA